MPSLNTNTEAWAVTQKQVGEGRYLRHLLFGADVDSTNENPRFKYPITLQPVASNTTDLLTLNEDYNGIALSIDSEATTADVVNISPATLTTALVIDIPDANALTTGGILNLVSNSASTGTRTLVQLTNDHTSATGTTLVGVLQDSTGTALSLDHNGATGKTVFIDSEATTQTDGIVDISPAVLTTGTVIDIGDADLLTSGKILNLVSNAPDTTARTLVQITNDHTSATGATVLGLLNDSTGSTFFIDHNGVTGKALYIDSEGTTQTGGVVDIAATVLTTGTVVDIGDADALTTGGILNMVSNSADTGTRTLVQLTNDHTSATGTTLIGVLQDSTGTALSLDHNGATGKSIFIDSEATTQTGGIVDISPAVLTTGTVIDIGDADLLTSGKILNLVSNAPDTTARTLVQITNDHTSATGAIALGLQNDSTSDTIFVDHNGITGRALYIDSEGTTQTGGVVDIAATVLTTGTVVDIGDADALTSGKILNLVSNAPDTTARTLVQITNDHTSATGAIALSLLNDSTSDTVFVDHNGITGKALYIDSEGTTQTSGVVDIAATVLTTGTVVDIGDADALTSGKILNLVSNSASATARVLVEITQDHTSATGAVPLNVTNDSTGNDIQIINRNTGALGAKLALRHMPGTAAAADNDVTGRIIFTAEDEEAAQVERTVGQIDVLWTDATSVSYGSRFIFYTSTGAAQNEAMRLLDTGKLQVDLASEIAGTTGVADVFDDHDDLAIIRKWREDPALRREFVDTLEEMGIVERKSSGSGYMLDVQGTMKLTWGAFNQMGDVINDQQNQIDELRGMIGEIVANNAVHGMPNQLGG